MLYFRAGEGGGQKCSDNPMVDLFYGQYRADGINEGRLLSWNFCSYIYCPPPFRRKVEGHCFWFSVGHGAWF